MPTKPVLPDAALDQLFRQAHTVHAFRPEPVSDDTLKALYDLLKWAPTAFNGQPGRYVFVKSEAAKARLLPALMAGNVPQVQSAAATVIVAQDSRFFEHLPTQFPAYDAKPLFEGNAGREHRVSQQQPAGRLPDHGGAVAGAGRGRDVWL